MIRFIIFLWFSVYCYSFYFNLFTFVAICSVSVKIPRHFAKMQGYRPKSSLKGLGGGLSNRPMSSINGMGFGTEARPLGKSPFDDLPKEEYSQLPEKVAERMEQEIR